MQASGILVGMQTNDKPNAVMHKIIDSHIHFWDPTLLRYPWLEHVPAIAGSALPSQLREQSADVNLQGIVFVQAGGLPEDGLAEAQWVSSLAQSEPRIRAIVAYAPVELGDGVRPYLVNLAKLPLVKGVRRNIQSDPAEICTQPDFILGVQAVAEYGYTFDICIHQAQLSEAIELVEACPNVRFVLDHFGKPLVREGVLDPWRENLQRLAAYPNVWCKISGLATEADREHWTRDDLRPYLDHALDAFAPDRVMFGGDWPVSTLAISYAEWVNIVSWAVEGMSDEHQQMLFANNAADFYDLEK